MRHRQSFSSASQRLPNLSQASSSPTSKPLLFLSSSPNHRTLSLPKGRGKALAIARRDVGQRERKRGRGGVTEDDCVAAGDGGCDVGVGHQRRWRFFPKVEFLFCAEKKNEDGVSRGWGSTGWGESGNEPDGNETTSPPPSPQSSCPAFSVLVSAGGKKTTRN